MKYAKVRDVKSPERGTGKSAGIDFFVPNDFDAILYPHKDILIPSGIIVEIPENCMLMAADKSGVVTSKHAIKSNGLIPKNEAFDGSIIIGAKIIDEDYQGEIHIHLINTSNYPVRILPGRKIAQFIIVPIIYEDFEQVPKGRLFTRASERGAGAFGSTGTR